MEFKIRIFVKLLSANGIFFLLFIDCTSNILKSNVLPYCSRKSSIYCLFLALSKLKYIN